MSASNVVAKAKITPNLPANYDEELAADALAMAKRIGSPSGDLIRTNKDKTFSLPSGATAPTLSVIVVGFVTVNQYYPGKYDAKNIQPPVCMAIGQEIQALRPFDKSTQKQNDDCHTCWANQWGSDGKGKACKNQRMLALLAPDMQADGPIMLLKVSPTGTRYWDSYVNKAIGIAGALIKVKTLITFDEASEYASLRFNIDSLNEGWKDAFARRAPALDRLLAEPEFAPAVVAEKPKGAK